MKKKLINDKKTRKNEGKRKKNKREPLKLTR